MYRHQVKEAKIEKQKAAEEKAEEQAEGGGAAEEAAEEAAVPAFDMDKLLDEPDGHVEVARPCSIGTADDTAAAPDSRISAGGLRCLGRVGELGV